MDLFSQGEEMAEKQYEKFKRAARDLGCDESEEAFDATLKRIAKAPPQKDGKSKDKEPGQ